MRSEWPLTVGALLGALLVIGCDDGDGVTPDATPVDARPVEPDQSAAGCERDIDCLAAEYCERELAAEASDAEPPLGMCMPGCRIEPDTCPVGRMCSPVSRVCVADCLCDPGAVDGCDGEALRVCADDCLQFVGERCAGDQICMGGQCGDRPPPMPDMAPPPEPDMAPPPEPDMAPPPESDMAPPAPDMAPPPPDMAPPEAP